jgi:hypothetical protein
MGSSATGAQASCLDASGVTTAADAVPRCRRMARIRSTARRSRPRHCNRHLAGRTWRSPGFADVTGIRVSHAVERIPAAGNNDQ